MAIGTNLPPQAYTRETLTQAFNWLQTQPERIKRMAQSPDALIAIYTRSQRYGNSGETEAPVSSQNFISDLKQLAEGLKQFDQPEVATPSPVRPAPAPSASATARSGATLPAPPVVAPQAAATMPPAAPTPGPSAPVAVNSSNWLDALHPTSQAMVAQIKDQLNLTADTEAVNMMIAVAYKSLKNLI